MKSQEESGATQKQRLPKQRFRDDRTPVALFTKHLTIEIPLKRKLTSAAYFTKTLTTIVSEIFLVTLRVPETTRKFKIFS